MLLIPTISIFNLDLYNDILVNTTVRVDLELFPFDGFKTPLFKHIVLLYFFTPEFANTLSNRK